MIYGSDWATRRRRDLLCQALFVTRLRHRDIRVQLILEFVESVNRRWQGAKGAHAMRCRHVVEGHRAMSLQNWLRVQWSAKHDLRQ